LLTTFSGSRAYFISKVVFAYHILRWHDFWWTPWASAMHPTFLRGPTLAGFKFRSLRYKTYFKGTIRAIIMRAHILMREHILMENSLRYKTYFQTRYQHDSGKLCYWLKVNIFMFAGCSLQGVDVRKFVKSGMCVYLLNFSCHVCILIHCLCACVCVTNLFAV